MANNRRLGFSGVIERVYAHLFFFFFSFQIFSPMIHGVTFYIEYIVLLLNPFFLLWLLRQRFTPRVAIGLVILSIYTGLQPLDGIKFFTVIAGTLGLIYFFQRRLFYAPIYLAISIAVACVQFGLVETSRPLLAHAIGPSNLAHLAWGQYATLTYTNFFTIFWFPRVSGLSREAGFFASYVLTVFLAVAVNRAFEDRRIGFKESLIYALGGVLSLSKSTIAFGILAVLLKLKSYVDRIPMAVVAMAFIAGMAFIANHITGFLLEPAHGSILGRIGGFALIDNLTLRQLIFGTSNVANISGYLAAVMSATGATFLFGVGGWFVTNGATAFSVYVLVLFLFGIRSTGLLVILTVTATVGLNTNQNFCIVAYYIGYMLQHVDDFTILPRCNRSKSGNEVVLDYEKNSRTARS